MVSQGRVSRPMERSALNTPDGGASVENDLDLSELLAHCFPDRRVLALRPLEQRKHFAKRIVTYAATLGERHTAWTSTLHIVAKRYPSDRAQGGFQSMGMLWEAGFRPPCPLRVPRPYGYRSSPPILLQERAEGRLWADVAINGSPGERSARVAAWLVRLQQTPLQRTPLGERVRVDSTLASRVERYTTELSAPTHRAAASRLERMGERLVQSIAPDPVLALSHGDLHPKNVLVHDGVVTVIDLDTFALREAAFDVGYAIGQLLIMSRLRLGRTTEGAREALGLWRAYVEAGGTATWERTAFHVARTFLQSLHYELCVLRNGRADLVSPWLAAGERFLESDGPTTIEDLVRAG